MRDPQTMKMLQAAIADAQAKARKKFISSETLAGGQKTYMPSGHTIAEALAAYESEFEMAFWKCLDEITE